jgi:serine/threonine-protein kinase
VHEDVPVPSSIRPGIPAGIDELVRRATRRDPAQRFGDADAFLSAARVQKAQLPPATPWAPSPTDTLVVNREVPVEPAPALDAPEWVNQRPAAPAAGAAAEALDAALEPSPVAAQPPAQPEDPVHVTEVSHQTAPDEPRRPRRGRKALWLGVVALASVVALLVLAFGPLQRVTVPDLLGKTPTEAAAILATSNLVLDAQEADFSEEIAKGLIMSTDPGPESSARSGSTIQAVVSKGPERYDVPKLRKLTVEEAEVALGAANLVLGEQDQAYDDTVKKGDIISSDPPAGESVKPGTAVAVVVSQGPEPVTMPALEGTDGDAAEARLKDLGLAVDRSDKTSESVAKGLVNSTNPKGGAGTFRGETVELVVSKGPPLVTVPNVVGKNEAEARAALEDAGFAVSENKPLGFVVFGVNSQNPRGGTKAPKGSTVTITVV